MASPIEEIFIKLGFKVDKKPLDDTDKSVKNVISSVKKIATATVLAIAALDRMATSLGRNNQELINFTRQTGLSIDNLNKIAGAGMLIDINFSSEKAAQGLMSLQSNLAQIRLGQGNIEPFQILGVSPVGKDATQIIEDLRETIKGVDDMTAVNLIQQMGLSPEFISLLRLTKGEYNDLIATSQKFMLNEEQRAALQKYSIELRKMHMEMAYLKDKALLAILPVLNQFFRSLLNIINFVVLGASKIKSLVDYIGQLKYGLLALGSVAIGLTALFNPLLAVLTALYLILEDFAVWALGGDSLFKLGFEKMQEVLNPSKHDEKKTDESYKKTYGKDRTPIIKYLDWVKQGGILGTVSGGAKKTEDFYNKMLQTQQNYSNVNQEKNVTQNNYMNFSGTDTGISQVIEELSWAYLQADRVV
ncbi:MAG: hypothetical protein ACI3T9_05920 [Romboutsia timonensis]